MNMHIPGIKNWNMYYNGDNEAHECNQMLNNEELVIPTSDRSDRTDVNP